MRRQGISMYALMYLGVAGRQGSVHPVGCRMNERFAVGRLVYPKLASRCQLSLAWGGTAKENKTYGETLVLGRSFSRDVEKKH